MTFTPTKYKLMNCATGRIFDDAGWTLADPECDTPAMVRAVYEDKKFEISDDLDGFYRFSKWLPVKRTLKHSHAPVTYRSEALASCLGLENLYITFSGYFPKIGACMETCSFKETEAYSVCARLPEDNKRVLVVASAGNTARAFAKVCSDNNIPLLLSVPQDNISALWFHRPLNDCVKIIAAPAGCDYFDAIVLADKVCKSPKFLAEGGAKNIARRDGTIGSGTGTIAVWENNLRLIEDGRFGSHKMRLYPSQNDPFTIMYDSWKAASRALVPLSAEEARHQAAEIKAKVLSNRKPPYSLAGGLFDAISDAGGDIYKVTNDELGFWKEKFRELEGIDIYSAASVAVASLEKAVADGTVRKDEVIMLNITGGGESLTKEHHDVIYAKPDMVIDTYLPAEEIVSMVEKMFTI